MPVVYAAALGVAVYLFYLAMSGQVQRGALAALGIGFLRMMRE